MPAPDVAPRQDARAEARGCLARGLYAKAIELLEPVWTCDLEATRLLARSYARLARYADALTVLQQSLQRAPESLPLRAELADVLVRSGQITAGAEAYRSVLSYSPRQPNLLNNLALACSSMGQLAESYESLRRALALRPTDSVLWSNYLYQLSYSADVSPEERFREHCRWAEQYSSTEDALPPVPPVSNRLRIGYVSPDFGPHPVGHFLLPMLQHHRRDHFEVFCYDNGNHHDPYNERLRAAADHWRTITTWTDDEAAAIIRQDGIHILVDLAGHTAGNRLPLFARRPAPVQAAYLGYPGSTGLAAIGFRLTDAVADPPADAGRWHTEQLVRLPRGFLAFSPPEDCPEVRTRTGRNGGVVTFGGFHQRQKITPQMIAVWAKLLQTVPGSRLLLKCRSYADEGTRIALWKALADEGVARERVDLVARLPDRRSHFGLYNEIDIALDTYPYHGTATTCEALWMGTPVVVLAGETHHSRVGASLLYQVGLPELIARTTEEYIRIAVELAADSDRRFRYHATLRSRLQTSPLMDAEGLTRGVEDSYRTMWEVSGTRQFRHERAGACRNNNHEWL